VDGRLRGHDEFNGLMAQITVDRFPLAVWGHCPVWRRPPLCIMASAGGGQLHNEIAVRIGRRLARRFPPSYRHGRAGGHPRRHRWGTAHAGLARERTPAVYILASKPNGILYIGVTSDLADRMAIHNQKLRDGFTKRYAVDRLVYYEMLDAMDSAILRETRLKKWKRAWKVRLIQQMNPEWQDLFDKQSGEILEGPADRARFGE
jgi:putative endonuclease